jgi:hypothetical protein
VYEIRRGKGGGLCTYVVLAMEQRIQMGIIERGACGGGDHFDAIN